jgi:flavodoxin
MKTIIIVHSSTGTTLNFAEDISDQLKKEKHDVKLVHLQTDPVIKGGSVPKTASIKFTNLPDIKDYELILLGGPVWGFSASPIAIAALEKLGKLSGKKILPFVTMGFPFPAMGGNRAISMMSDKAKELGATVLPGKIIPKLFHNFKKQFKIEAKDIAKIII